MGKYLLKKRKVCENNECREATQKIFTVTGIFLHLNYDISLAIKFLKIRHMKYNVYLKQHSSTQGQVDSTHLHTYNEA